MNYAGREVEAEEMPFQIERDGDVRIRTEDGALLRLRPVVFSVLRTNATPTASRSMLCRA